MGVIVIQKIYTYTLSAIKEGTWTIPAAQIYYKGREYQSNAIPVKVVKYQVTGEADPAVDIPKQKMQDLFLWATVSNSDPYVGEAIEVSFDVYTRLKVTNFSVQQAPSFSGFWAEEVEMPKNPRVSRKVVNGVEFSEATVHKVELYPTVSGELIIDPLNMVFEVETQQSESIRSIF